MIRHFHEAFAAALLAGAVCSAMPAAAQVIMLPMHESPQRQVTVLADDWRFHPGDMPVAATGRDFDDTGWETVSVPHTWNRVGFYRPAPATHINTAENVDKRQGIGWYRLRFTPGEVENGRRTWLEFDAASRIASVWLNGTLLGRHEGGFSRFRFDATETLIPGAENVLAVQADNSAPADPSETTADVLPLTGDFFVHGGLYRPVRLVTTDALHFDMKDFGGSGVLATTATASAETAQVGVRMRVANDTARTARTRVTASLVNADGQVVAKTDQRLTLAAGATQEASATLEVPRPHLWNGVADPYLHTLVVEVADAGGTVRDRVAQPFGIRTVRVDPERGLFLNGQHLQLRGVGYHQDREGKGWAIAPADVEADVQIMREMGVNTIRLTHYQHGPAIHALADRYGLLLWDEIPLVSAWTRRGEVTPRPELVANAQQQLRELIRQNGNHPSVITWGIANEVDFGNSFPAFLTGYPEGQSPDPMPLLNTLNTLARQEDPSRPTALATCCEGRLFADGVDIPETAAAAELGGANRYFGWYFGAPEDFGPNLDALRAKRPEQPLSVTEYGAGADVTLHTDDVRGGPIDSRGFAQPEEYASYIHEEAWKTLRARPYLWGTWLWNSFDFATTIRAEGDTQDINTKGLVTYDRKIRKDPYYFYKANWTDTPTVHINSRRYVDRAYPVTDVRVYSNAPTTELTLNGRALPSMRDCVYRVCVWPRVRLDAGANTLVATGRFADGSATQDNVSWTLAPDQVGTWRIDAGAVLAPRDAAGWGSDAFFAGGAAGTLDVPADYGKPAQPAQIAGADNRAIATTYRQGRFAYRLPLPDGRYRVTLTFVEPTAAAGERVFDVAANGTPAMTGIDIAREAGGTERALRKTAQVTVSGGMLDLAFTPITAEAIVSAIEIEEAARGGR